MIDAEKAVNVARAWLAGQIEISPAAWPSLVYGNFDSPDEYFVFTWRDPADPLKVGGSDYVAVHKRTGEVHALGCPGE